MILQFERIRSLIMFLLQTDLHKIPKLRRKRIWALRGRLLLNNTFHTPQIHWVPRPEELLIREVPQRTFQKNLSKTPNIHTMIIMLCLKSFWRHIFYSTNPRSCCTHCPHLLLADSKVCNFHLTLSVYENILGFDIPVNNVIIFFEGLQAT